MIEISYLTELSKPYVNVVQEAATFEELLSVVKTWQPLVQDAFEAVIDKDFSWDEYAAGCKKERRGKYAGDKWAEKYGAILMPAVLMYVGLQAEHFKVPEGAMFIRLKEFGIITQDDAGTYILNVPRAEP